MAISELPSLEEQEEQLSKYFEYMIIGTQMNKHSKEKPLLFHTLHYS